MSDREKIFDRAALADAFLQCSPKLRRYVDGSIPTRSRKLLATDDVLQDVWIHALAGLAKFTPDGPGAVERWLGTICQRALLEGLRRARAAKRAGDLGASQACDRRRTSLEPLIAAVQSPDRTPSRDGAAREARELLRKSLSAIGPVSRRAVELRYLDGLSHREIAAQMGKSKAAVNSLLYRALSELRDVLGGPSRFFSDT